MRQKKKIRWVLWLCVGLIGGLILGLRQPVPEAIQADATKPIQQEQPSEIK